MNMYTVIGYFEDNGQPWMEHVEADDPEEAAHSAFIVMVENHDAVLGTLRIVEVIEGYLKGCLGNDLVMVGEE